MGAGRAGEMERNEQFEIYLQSKLLEVESTGYTDGFDVGGGEDRNQETKEF